MADVITRILRVLRAMSDHVGGVEPGTTHSAFKKELDEIEAAHNEGLQSKESGDDKDKSPAPAVANMAPPAGPPSPRPADPAARPAQPAGDQRPSRG